MSISYGGNNITFPDASTQNTSPKTGFVNRIINGGMTIDQRNAGASVTADGVVSYTLDRWQAAYSQNNKYSIQQNAGSVTPPAGFTNYLGCTSLAATSLGASDYFLMLQKIEGFNIADLGWGTANAATVTLSFLVRSSITGTFGGSLRNGAGDRSYPFTYTVSAANTFEYKTITIPGDTSGTWLTTNGNGIQLHFSLGAGSTFSGTAGAWAAANFFSATGATSVVGTSGATFFITGCQLEKGSTATPFEFRSIGDELNLCLRYFQTYSNPPLRGVMSGTTAANRCGMILPVLMRAQPTATVGALDVFDGSGVSNVSSVNVAYLNTKSIEFSLNLDVALVAGRPAIVYQTSSTNNLSLSAEL